MRLIDADALMAQFPCTCGCKNCGQMKDGILPCDIKDKIKEAPTIENPKVIPVCTVKIDKDKMKEMIDSAISELAASCPKCGNHMEIQKNPRMTKEKCDEITEKIRRLFLNGGTLFADVIEGDEEEKMHVVACLLDYIASLHNELYKQVFGKYYDYMFHWANLGYGGSPNDSMFKDAEEVKKDEHPENNDH